MMLIVWMGLGISQEPHAEDWLPGYPGSVHPSLHKGVDVAARQAPDRRIQRSKRYLSCLPSVPCGLQARSMHALLVFLLRVCMHY